MGRLPRIGFIGCGPFSSSSIYPALHVYGHGLQPDTQMELAVRGDRTHLTNVLAAKPAPLVELVACCDQKEDLARRNQRAFGFERYYTDYHEMLEKEDLDSVFVVMHPKNGPRIAMDVMKSGRNAYIEKPPGTTLAEAQEIQAVSKATGKFCQVGFMKRFSEPFMRAKAISEMPDFGRLSVYESRKARNGSYTPDTVYHFLNGFVCHHFDLARYFMGDVESVYADMVSRSEADPTGMNQELVKQDDIFSNYYQALLEKPHVRQADGYLILFRFESGAIGMHNANCLEHNANVLERVTLTGEGAVTVVEDWWTVKGYVKGHDPIVWEPIHVDAGGPIGMLKWSGYLGEVEEFIAATAEGRQPSVTIDDGVKCLEIETAVRKSLAEGRRVAISEVR